MKYLCSVVFVTILAGCVSYVSPDNSDLEYQIVTDCISNSISSQEKAVVLDVVNKWAIKQCLVPCEMEMCASLDNLNDESISIYVAHQYENMIGPEGLVTISRNTNKVIDSQLWHASCTPGCVAESRQ